MMLKIKPLSTGCRMHPARLDEPEPNRDIVGMLSASQKIYVAFHAWSVFQSGGEKAKPHRP